MRDEGDVIDGDAEGMDWPQAQYAILDGKRVTRREWHEPGEVIFLADGWLKVRKANGSLHQLIVSDLDMQAHDWIVAREN